MTKRTVDIIPKIKLSTTKNDIKRLPEIIYTKVVARYADTIRTEVDIDREWSSVFLQEIESHYKEQSSSFELLSIIEFGLDNREFKSKKISTYARDTLYNNGYLNIAKNIKYNFPLEAKQSSKLLNILLEYIFQTQYKDNATVKVDSYTKSMLKNFTKEFQHRDLVKGSQLGEFAFEAYPSIMFAQSSEYLIAIAIKPNNIHFIDNKVEDEDKVFNISFAIYKTSKSNINIEFEPLSSYFNSFSMFLYKEKLDANIKDSMGEAADIARYWYTQGLRNLNNMQDTFDKSTDSFDFSEAFVKEILTADVPGVKNIEVYPFDRCFIFKDSALVKNELDVKIIVSEASLLQKSISDDKVIKDRDNFLYEWERFYKEIKDYDIDFSNKNIEFENFDIKSSEGANQELISNDSRTTILSNKHDKIKDFKHDDEKAIDFMLYNLLTHNAEPKEILDLEKKYFDNDDGLCYIYNNGVNLKNMPFLKSFQEAYWKNIAQLKKGNLPEGLDFDKFISEVPIDNTKVVFISYDPTRAKKSSKKITIESKHAFSILIIANWDIPKTISEIIAEKEDLNTALKLIIRQKTESAELIKYEREKQKKFILNQLRQAIHAIKGSIQDEDIKKKINDVYERFKDKLKDDQLELSEFKVNDISPKQRVSKLLKKLKDDSFNLQEPEALWDTVATELDPNNFLSKELSFGKDKINFRLQESFLPDFIIKLDKITIQETFHVMLKNAVEAACNSKEKSLTIYIDVAYLSASDALLNICFINDTKPISRDRLNVMNDSFDDIAPNEEKEGSTGAGVASSRSQLQSRFGSSANIKFKLLGHTKIKSILTLPIELIQNPEYYKTVEEDQDVGSKFDILYLEDETCYIEPSVDFLNKYNLAFKHSDSKDKLNSYWSDAKVLFTDINVYNKGQKKRAGIQASLEFFEQSTNGTIFILTSESPSDIINDFKGKIPNDKIYYENIDSIEIGNVYILVQKTISDACEAYPTILTLLQNLNDENKKTTLTVKAEITLDVLEVSELTLPQTFNELKDVYSHQKTTLDDFSTIYSEWVTCEYFHPEEEMQDSISSPDIFSNLLIIPIVVQQLDNLDYNRITLFGLKKNIILIPILKSTSIDLNELYMFLQKNKDIDIRNIGIFSAINHDLSNIALADAEEITKQIISLDIYHDGKNLTDKNIFDIGIIDESDKIKELYTSFSNLLEKNKDLESDLAHLQKSLHYFIELKQEIQKVVK